MVCTYKLLQTFTLKKFSQNFIIDQKIAFFHKFDSTNSIFLKQKKKIKIKLKLRARNWNTFLKIHFKIINHPPNLKHVLYYMYGKN